MTDFDSGVARMISGSHEAVQHIYDIYQGKSGFLWLVPFNIESKADHIYVQGKKGSDGFAGRPLTFDIRHGDTLTLNGPWSSTADELLSDTGVDLTDQYSGRVVIGLERGKAESCYQTIIKDVVYDSGEEIGLFAHNRLDIMGKIYANELKRKVYGYSKSFGGAMSAAYEPDGEDA